MKVKLLLVCTLFSLAGYCQFSGPVVALEGPHSNQPLLFYVSGDGGWNRFSTTLLQELHKRGFPIIGLDARNFFWTKKTPQQAAQAITGLIRQHGLGLSSQNLIFIGYSFGADVLPFIEPLLAPSLAAKVKRTILLSPSSSTDFEVHLLSGFAIGSQQDVPEAINRLANPVTLFFGSNEKDFPLTKLRKAGLQYVTLPGGHHYDGQVDQLVAHLLPHLGNQ